MVLLMLGIVIGRLRRPSRDDAQKLSPYECGFEAFEDSRMKFDVRYYLVAILFIVFDLEIAFLFPWAVALDSIGVVRTRSRWASSCSSWSWDSSTSGRKERSNGIDEPAADERPQGFAERGFLTTSVDSS